MLYSNEYGRPHERAMSAEATPSEQGLPAPPAPLAAGGSLPPNAGRLIAPHYQTFTSVVNWASRTYRYTFDEALKDSRTNALAMRRDPVIWSALRKRQRPTCQLEWQLIPDSPNDPKQEENARRLSDALKDVPNFQQLKRVLLEKLFYGRYGAQLVTAWDYAKGYPRLNITDWFPVNGDKIAVRWDGTPGLYVNMAHYAATYPDKEITVTDRGPVHFLTPAEREVFLWGSFEPEDADYFEGNLGGAVHGLGYRGRLYWYWWLRNTILSQFTNFTDRVASGWTVFFYEAGNEESRAEVYKAASDQIQNNTLLFPRNRDGQSAYSGPGIERVEPSMGGAQLFLQTAQWLDSVMTDAILGETLTTDTAPTGLGSGVASAHEGTAEQRTRYDAVDLRETLQELVNTLHRYNAPAWGWGGMPSPRFEFLIDKPDVGEYLQAMQAAYEMGLEIDEDDAREVLALPRPEEGHDVISQVKAQQRQMEAQLQMQQAQMGMEAQAQQQAGGGSGGQPGQPPEAGARPGPSKVRYRKDQRGLSRRR
jgi:hypothetical protein